VSQQGVTSAERMRRLRQRRLARERVLPFEVKETEVEALVALGFLSDADRSNGGAISSALGQLLSRIPPAYWPTAHEVLIGKTARRIQS
jgi:hypothetical protein